MVPETPESEEADGGVSIAEKPRDRTAEPPRFVVVLHNDDFTTMEFVIEILQRYFRKSFDEAMQVMLRVHHDGRGAAGIYTYDIAETKVAEVEKCARSRGFPLKCTVEPA